MPLKANQTKIRKNSQWQCELELALGSTRLCETWRSVFDQIRQRVVRLHASADEIRHESEFCTKAQLATLKSRTRNSSESWIFNGHDVAHFLFLPGWNNKKNHYFEWIPDFRIPDFRIPDFLRLLDFTPIHQSCHWKIPRLITERWRLHRTSRWTA